MIVAGNTIPVAMWPPHGGTPDQCASARLIAAAPELLAACEAALALFDDCLDGKPRTVAIANSVRAAIERARGAK